VNPIHIVIGPTSSGKSEYAVRLAKKVKGEIISADSRQVYKGFYLASGQVPGKWEKIKNSSVAKALADRQRFPPKANKIKATVFIYKNIPHHCIDFVSPKRIYTVSDFVRDGRKALSDILARGKTPIICGGTGLYIDALLFDLNIPEVPPNKKFREKMEKLSTEQLFAQLQKLDPVRANNIDRHNPRRLIRALEIINHTGKPVPLLKNNKQQITNNKFPTPPSHSGDPLPFVSLLHSDHSGEIRVLVSRIHSDNSGESLPFVSPLVLKLKAVSYQLQPEFHYLNPPQEKLFNNIEKRLEERVKQGMLKEIWQAHQKGVSWKRLEGMGLEFRHTSRFLRSLNSRHSDAKYSFVSPPNSDHSRDPLPFVSLFLKSQHFQDLLSDTKKYTKRQNTWFKRYLPTLSKS
jgi:tRNA A37 N6-isopentenylltransferase MiaA